MSKNRANRLLYFSGKLIKIDVNCFLSITHDNLLLPMASHFQFGWNCSQEQTSTALMPSSIKDSALMIVKAASAMKAAPSVANHATI